MADLISFDLFPLMCAVGLGFSIIFLIDCRTEQKQKDREDASLRKYNAEMEALDNEIEIEKKKRL